MTDSSLLIGGKVSETTVAAQRGIPNEGFKIIRAFLIFQSNCRFFCQLVLDVINDGFLMHYILQGFCQGEEVAMIKQKLKKSSWVCIAFALVGVLGCGGGSSSSDSISDNPADEPVNLAVIDSAASFLAAATGKENPIGVDQVVFVNTVLGINQPVQDSSISAAAVKGSSSDSSMGCLYGDLWVTLRDENGVPILDAQGCKQPIASSPIELPLLDANGDPILDDNDDPMTYFSETVPMIFGEDEQKCSVIEGYEDYTIPVELGRLNMVRSSVKNPDTMARALEEAMKNINASTAIEKDLSGRLTLISERDVLDEDGNVVGTQRVESTIDSPRENLALYRALMVHGRLVGYGVEKIGEEGQTIPAPWLELRSDLELGELAYLRDGTPGRDFGVGKVDGYADLSAVYHATELDYADKYADYVQFHPDGDPNNACPYTDENDDVWFRVFNNDIYQGENIAGFARHADDARRMIVFMHNIIQDVPKDPSLPTLDSDHRGGSVDHMQMPEIASGFYARHLMFETAASALGAASGKEIPLSIDATVFVNTVLGINDLGEVAPKDLYGDLWILKRDANGVPLRDENECVMPIASQPLELPQMDDNGDPVLDDNGNVVTYSSETIPMILEEYMDGLLKCAPAPDYEDYVMEVEMGRLNCSRSSLNNPGMMDRHLFEVVNRINKAVEIKRDLAGRIILTTLKDDIPVDATIDSPLENMAVYRALMKSGTLEVPVTVNIEGTKETRTLEITLSDDVLNEHGMGYLKYGDGSPGSPRGIDITNGGYADFSEVSHCPKADYEGVLVDFVERQDGVCPYEDRIGIDIWPRVLNAEIGVEGEEDNNPASHISAFVQHADNARRVINFIHSVIHDPVVDL